MPVSMKRLPDLCLLRRTFNYDHKTGEVRFLDSLPHLSKTTQTKLCGKIAGVVQDGRRSLSLTFNGVLHRMAAYRVGWALYYGEDPYPFEIDHIDGDPSNDQISNLRVATRSQNMRNTRQSLTRPSNTGVRGVCFKKGGYEVHIRSENRDLYIGRFKTVNEADAAYKSAAELLHGPFAVHFSPQMRS